jgi:hypothetical protein
MRVYWERSKKRTILLVVCMCACVCVCPLFQHFSYIDGKRSIFCLSPCMSGGDDTLSLTFSRSVSQSVSRRSSIFMLKLSFFTYFHFSLVHSITHSITHSLLCVYANVYASVYEWVNEWIRSVITHLLLSIYRWCIEKSTKSQNLSKNRKNLNIRAIWHIPSNNHPRQKPFFSKKTEIWEFRWNRSFPHFTQISIIASLESPIISSISSWNL